MAPSDDPMASCRHDRAPLRRLGKIAHQRTGQAVYVLLCTACGFTVTTDELRRIRDKARTHPPRRPPPRKASPSPRTP